MQKAKPFPQEWKLIWNDEFDYTGAPDPKKWGYELGLVRNHEAQTYTKRKENVRVENGNLVIEARREAFEGAAYTSASVNTLGKTAFLYGRIEVRAKIPVARGQWPAIWMMGENIGVVGWPRCGEIDIMEHVGHEPGIVHATMHWGASGAKHQADGGTITIPKVGDDFHVYAVEWHPDRIDAFIDGKKYWTFPYTTPDKWAFDGRCYLLLNLAVGGDWGGQKGIDDAAFPQKYLVNYVRVYQSAAYKIP
ncbi:MAG: glycoside hydrolase family 16 protein [Armatimonadetes bacterium]|nr:glycoside hydrolase family 16 protein [Armatimonadota bacterium]